MIESRSSIGERPGFASGINNFNRELTNVETITFSGADVHLLAGDLNHAIVKRGCRDEDTINLSDRFDYINGTSDGSLDRWD